MLETEISGVDGPAPHSGYRDLINKELKHTVILIKGTRLLFPTPPVVLRLAYDLISFSLL